jgi:hypothetical protein
MSVKSAEEFFWRANALVVLFSVGAENGLKEKRVDVLSATRSRYRPKRTGDPARY